MLKSILRGLALALFALLLMVASSACGVDCSSDPTTITVAGGTIFVHGKDGYLYALDASTGAMRWSTKVWAPSGFRAVSPVASATTVFIAADQTVAALRVGTGDLEWRVTPTNVRSITHLAVDQDSVYAWTAAGMLVALKSQDGTEVWRSTVFSSTDGASSVLRSTIFSTAGIVVLTGARVRALDRLSGATRWEYVPNGGEWLLPPAVLESTLYLSGSRYTVTALSLTNGAVRFRTTLMPPPMIATPGATPQLSPVLTPPPTPPPMKTPPGATPPPSPVLTPPLGSDSASTPTPTVERAVPAAYLAISLVLAAEQRLYVATWQGIFALDARTGTSRPVVLNPAGGTPDLAIRDHYLVYRTSTGIAAAGPTYVVKLPEEAVLPSGATEPQLIDYHADQGGFPTPCGDDWRYRNGVSAVDILTARPIWTVSLYNGSVRPSAG